MQSHELDYKIIGDDIQLVDIELDPHETVIQKQVQCFIWKKVFYLKRN